MTIKQKKDKTPRMSPRRMKIFWVYSIANIAATLFFNSLVLIDTSLWKDSWRYITDFFFFFYWLNIMLVILVIFKFSNRENDTGQLIIILNYALCMLLFIIMPLMGLNTLLLGVLPHTGLTGSTLEFTLLQLGQMTWTYIIIISSLALSAFIFIAMRKDESIWSM